jgi:hypothetical protein
VSVAITSGFLGKILDISQLSVQNARVLTGILKEKIKAEKEVKNEKRNKI